MARAFRFWVVAAISLVLAAGCVGGPGEGKTTFATDLEPSASESSGPAASGDEAALITGSVVDPELVPIAGVTVTANPGTFSTTTDAAGAYSLGPVAPGAYTLRGEKAGYRGKEVGVDVVAGEPVRVVLTLERLPSSDGYFETMTLAGYIQCQIHANPPNINAPCSTFGVEYFGGPKTLDSYQFLFDVSAPGFKELVLEATWEPSTNVEGHAQFWIAMAADATNVVAGTGGTPIWHKAIAGIKNDGNDAVFYPTPDATESFQLGMIGLGGGSATVPGVYHWIEWRYNVYLTFFHNGAAPADFTVLTT